MQEGPPIELEALEVYLHPSIVSQTEWQQLYNKIRQYIKNLDDNEIVVHPKKVKIESMVEVCHIHIQIMRSFTTDVIQLYSNLTSYINQEETLIFLGMSNEYGKVSTPLIIDLIVLIQLNIPGIIMINGYLHPVDWSNAIQRLQKRGMLFNLKE